ncbi:MAG TPA: B-box zinc finger protein [Planctomycetota bacterium]|nr:B-box zinc finger protein [Planctomycetota bacterium]
MPDSCAKHPDRASAGACKRCGGSTCPVCMLDVDGSIFCSLLCFTEQTLSTKRRTLREPALPPPTPETAPAAEVVSPEPAPAAPADSGSGDAFDDVWARLEAPADASPAATPAAEAASADPLADIGLDASSGSMPKAPSQTESQAMLDVEQLFKKFGGAAPAPEPRFVDSSRTNIPVAEPAPEPEPAAGSDFNEPSIMMSAAQADLGASAPKQDDSSIMTPSAGGDEGTSILELNALRRDDGTSVLDMGAVKPLRDPSEDIGSSALMNAVKKDNTSILGMQSIPKAEGAGERMPFVIPDQEDLEEPAVPATPEDLPPPERPRLPSVHDAPEAETPLPMILPGTRRSTIQATCVFHPDLPAVVLCSACGDAICTLCVTDEAHGGRCAPSCRRDDPVRKRSRAFGAILGASAAAAIVGAVWLYLMAGKEPPPTKIEPAPPPPVAVAIPKPEPPPPPPPPPPPAPPPKPEPKPEPKPDPKPEPPPPPPPPPPPKPEPPPSLHLAFLRDPWGKEKVGAWYRVKTSVAGKDGYKDTGLRESGAGYRVLVSQTSVDGKTEPEQFVWTEPQDVSIFGSVNGDVKGKKYAADVVRTKPTALSQYVLKDGPWVGAYFASDATLARLETTTVKVKDREFACTVLETEPKEGTKSSTTWLSLEVPLAIVKWESAGSTSAIVDFGEAWEKRPAFPAPPAPPPPPPPPPLPPAPPALPPPPPPKPPPTVLELAMLSASDQIREATPGFTALADDLDPNVLPMDSVQEQQSRVDGVQRRLVGARSDYSRILADAPDKATVERRIQILGELIETLTWGAERVRVPRLLRQAAVRVAEAVPLYARVANGRDSAQDASERTTLRTMQDLALSKLREARLLYMQAKGGSPDPERIGQRIRSLDALIDTLSVEPAPADVPALLKQAAAQIKEAMPFYQKFSDGAGTAADGERARELLWSARTAYLRAQAAGGSDADKLAPKIASLDELIATLDGVLPSRK